VNDYHDDEPVIIEGYCVRCRESIEIEEPQAVWTRTGMPATRGGCPLCAGTVFRMGKTELHANASRPQAVDVGDGSKRKGPKLPKNTVYLAFAEADQEIARQIAADLEKSGLTVWLHEPGEGEAVAWAAGVHPALKTCSRLVYVMSPAAVEDEGVTASWQFFRSERKPILIAQLSAIDPPDPIRRSIRFDFAADYKTALRRTVQELS
jgi:hypothetical protein